MNIDNIHNVKRIVFKKYSSNFNYKFEIDFKFEEFIN